MQRFRYRLSALGLSLVMYVIFFADPGFLRISFSGSDTSGDLGRVDGGASMQRHIADGPVCW